MMTPEQKIAEACRLVALRLEDAIERGRRSNRMDANDLLKAILSVADQLDPPAESEPDIHLELLAAWALLEAREDQMVTSAEWDRLQRVVAAATPR